MGEIRAIVKVLLLSQDGLVNIFSDSKYSVQVAKMIPFAVFNPTNKPIDQMFKTLKELTENRKHPWYISHVRSILGYLALFSKATKRLIVLSPATRLPLDT